MSVCVDISGYYGLECVEISSYYSLVCVNINNKQRPDSRICTFGKPVLLDIKNSTSVYYSGLQKRLFRVTFKMFLTSNFGDVSKKRRVRNKLRLSWAKLKLIFLR